MNNSIPLLPRGFKPLGFVFITIGLLLGYLRFHLGYKPELLNFKTFAFYSKYLEPKLFSVIKNQFLEEFAAIFIVLGLFAVAFTKEKTENDRVTQIRLKALWLSMFVNTIFVLVALIFTFGLGFIYMLIFNMVFVLLSYIIILRILFLMSKKGGGLN
jgi:hypothetical protein